MSNTVLNHKIFLDNNKSRGLCVCMVNSVCIVGCSSFVGLDDYELIQSELDQLVAQSHIVLFMKGSRKFPICRLSSGLCYMLKQCNLEFSTVDLLIKPQLSLFMRAMHEPISAPYLYAGGKFVGGYETVNTMFNSGLLDSIVR